MLFWWWGDPDRPDVYCLRIRRVCYPACYRYMFQSAVFNVGH